MSLRKKKVCRKRKNVSLSTHEISGNNTQDINDIRLDMTTPVNDTVNDTNKPVNMDSDSDSVNELSVTTNIDKTTYEQYSIDFDPILDNLEDTIHQFLEERLNQQKEYLYLIKDLKKRMIN